MAAISKIPRGQKNTLQSAITRITSVQPKRSWSRVGLPAFPNACFICLRFPFPPLLRRTKRKSFGMCLRIASLQFVSSLGKDNIVTGGKRHRGVGNGIFFSVSNWRFWKLLRSSPEKTKFFSDKMPFLPQQTRVPLIFSFYQALFSTGPERGPFATEA